MNGERADMSARRRKRPFKNEYRVCFVDSSGRLHLGGKGERCFFAKRHALRFARSVCGLVIRAKIYVQHRDIKMKEHLNKYRKILVSRAFASPEILKWWRGS